MATEPAKDQEPEANGTKRWGLNIAVLVILVLLGLVVYVTVKTTEIPTTVAVPLLAAAAFGLWAFRIQDFKG
jgi:hypothetical protein